MVPIYSIVAWLSIMFYNDSVYFEVIGDCYEAFAIASFFSLLCAYIAPDLHSQKDYFRGIQPKPWVWPLNWFQKWAWCGAKRGAWRNPRSGLTWFNVSEECDRLEMYAGHMILMKGFATRSFGSVSFNTV